MWYPIKSPFWLRWIYPHLTWHRSRKHRCLYLTFDDGPIPDVTPQILNILKSYGIKATFFCVGDNIQKHPEIFERIKTEGHQIGNHTYHHLKGWDTSKLAYLENVERCHQLTQSRLFRPPYARGTRAQYSELIKNYEIMMWDVMSGDFDPKMSPAQCLNNVINHAENGSIIVFHDNIKALPRVIYALPRAIEHWLKDGYEFKTLEIVHNKIDTMGRIRRKGT